jgi:hypothetical protein
MPSGLTNPSTWRQLIELAYQYGPFFFALLFTLVLARWTYGNYKDVCARKDPPAGNEEIQTCRWTFVFTSLFGVVLVAVTVGWWFRYRPALYVFQGQISRLRDYEKIACKDFFFRSRLLGKLGENLPEYRDEEFIAIQAIPFTDSQRFELFFSKSGGEPDVLPISFTKESTPQLHVEWDEGTHHNRLVGLGSAPPGTPQSTTTYIFPFEETALAEAKPAAGSLAKKPAGSPGKAVEADPKTARSIALLQDERTDVGTKIKVIDALSALGVSQLQDVARADTGKESVIVTLNDLTRHNDRELASKARSLLRRMDLSRVLAQDLTASDPKRSAAAEASLRRLDKTQALAVLQATDGTKSQHLKGLEQKVAAEQGTGPLIPTGSAQGDRYYVKARWQADQPATVACLTRLFNTELIDRPSIEKEAAFMKGRTERLVFWYSKDWAMHMADEIKKCGGQPMFVSVQ